MFFRGVRIQDSYGTLLSGPILCGIEHSGFEPKIAQCHETTYSPELARGGCGRGVLEEMVGALAACAGG